MIGIFLDLLSHRGRLEVIWDKGQPKLDARQYEANLVSRCKGTVPGPVMSLLGESTVGTGCLGARERCSVLSCHFSLNDHRLGLGRIQRRLTVNS